MQMQKMAAARSAVISSSPGSGGGGGRCGVARTFAAYLISRVGFILVLLMAGVHCDPILAPDLKYCHIPLDLPEEEPLFNCCAPDWDKPAIPFQFDESAPYNLKVRMPAHALDAEGASKLDKAYSLMKALPQDDPRSFIQQANIHCAYCDATYQMGNSTTPLQIHASWLFFSFHRWYIYFHERILAHLLGDDTFALPFWNYDHPDGMTIPYPYMNYTNLIDPFRDASHLPPTLVMVDYYYMNATEMDRGADERMKANLATIHRTVVTSATTQIGFFGQPYRKDDGPQPGYGTVETMPHNSLHGWVGDHFQVGSKDMGTLYGAGRDPAFYAHHANIDRLWEIWKSIDGNVDITDLDYLDSEFIFYNEYAELVKVKVRDSLDPIKLGYTYANVENLWFNMTTFDFTDGAAILLKNDTICATGEELLQTCSVSLKRDISLSMAMEEGNAEEVLIVEGIEGFLTQPAHFEAFINYPQATLSTPTNCTEYVGRFAILPQAVYSNLTGDYFNTSAYFAIGYNVQKLGLSKEENLVVTLVPRVESPYQPITIKSIRLHYETQGLSKKQIKSRFSKSPLKSPINTTDLQSLSTSE